MIGRKKARQARVEEALRERERRLALTYEHAGIGIAEVDAEGRVLRANAHLADMLCYPRDELLGVSLFDWTHPADVEIDRAQLERQVAGKIGEYSLEKRFVRRDGAIMWVQVTSSGVRDADGHFLYAVRVQHDITERKRIEEALARRAEEQAALHRFTQQLQHARSLGDVYIAALDAIQRALRCERASILLFDGNGVMRFAAWRNLSDGYRAAVEGHSPWTADAEDPQPILLSDTEHARTAQRQAAQRIRFGLTRAAASASRGGRAVIRTALRGSGTGGMGNLHKRKLSTTALLLLRPFRLVC